MQNYICPHCGSEKSPIIKSYWTTKDKIIAIVLTLAFFPMGIIYIIIKQTKNKRKICPDCQKFYNWNQEESVSDDISKMKNVIKTVATDPKVKQSVKDLRNSAKEFQDSFYIN